MSCFTCIRQSEVGILENMGEFDDVLPPGCHCFSCTKDVKGTVSLKVEILNVPLQCPSKEKTMVTLTTHVIHRVIPSYVHTAFYCLSGAQQQVTAFVQNSLRAAVPNYTIDELYLQRHELADMVKKDLEPQMTRFGREVIDLLIADLEPTFQVKSMFSQQMTMRYARMANQFTTDTAKIELVKKAEGDAECARLQGMGLAEQRKVIYGSMSLNLKAWQEAEKAGHHVPESEVIATMMMLQYFDMMSDCVKLKKSGPGAHVKFLPNLGTHSVGPNTPSNSSGVRQRKVITDDDI